MNRLIFLCLIILTSCTTKSQTKSTADISLRKSYRISIDNFLKDKNISQSAKDLYIEDITVNVPLLAHTNVPLSQAVN